jgi:sulfocyanin
MTPRFVRHPVRATVGTLVLALALPGMYAAASHHPGRAATPRWLVANAKTHTATLTLIAAYTNALNGFNFNGYDNGKMVITIPVGYRVTVIFSNKSSVPHSAVFTPYSQKNRNSHFPLAFKGATSPDPTSGITSGTTQRFTFTASKVGTYALVCGVPGHEQAGMWDVLKVTRGGTASLSFAGPVTTKTKLYTYKTTDGKTVQLDFPVYVRDHIVTQRIFNGFAFFDQYCFRCHGTDAVGGVYAPDLRNAVNSGLTREQFISIALAGIPSGGMPSWSKIFSRSDLESIYEYVKARAVNVLPVGRPNSG